MLPFSLTYLVESRTPHSKGFKNEILLKTHNLIDMKLVEEIKKYIGACHKKRTGGLESCKTAALSYKIVAYLHCM
jgi:hypothetical protein